MSQNLPVQYSTAISDRIGELAWQFGNSIRTAFDVTYMYMCMYMCMHMYMYMYMYMHMYMYMYMYMYMHMHMHMYIHMYMHMYMYTKSIYSISKDNVI